MKLLLQKAVFPVDFAHLLPQNDGQVASKETPALKLFVLFICRKNKHNPPQTKPSVIEN